MTDSVITNILLGGWFPMVILGGFMGIFGTFIRAHVLAGLGILMTVLGVFHLTIVMLCIVCSKIFLIG